MSLPGSRSSPAIGPPQSRWTCHDHYDDVRGCPNDVNRVYCTKTVQGPQEDNSTNHSDLPILDDGRAGGDGVGVGVW